MESLNGSKILNIVISLLVISSLYFGYQMYQLKKQSVNVEKFLNLATQNQYSAFINGTLQVNQK